MTSYYHGLAERSHEHQWDGALTDHHNAPTGQLEHYTTARSLKHLFQGRDLIGGELAIGGNYIESRDRRQTGLGALAAVATSASGGRSPRVQGG